MRCQERVERNTAQVGDETTMTASHVVGDLSSDVLQYLFVPSFLASAALHADPQS